MAKKDYFLLFDTETTVKDRVADFGAIICDKKGNIATQCAVLLQDIFGHEALFYDTSAAPSDIWSVQGKDRRFDAYNQMLNEGTRMLASVAGVNRWLEKAAATYNPIVTAYNLPFDVDKCQKTGIDLNMFPKRFCLWRASVGKWAHTKSYLQFVLNTHGFNRPTALGNMSYKTNAEIMARFVLGIPTLENEPHTAIEDVIGYELPILKRLVKTTSKSKYMDPKLSFNWRAVQVKDHYQPK